MLSRRAVLVGSGAAAGLAVLERQGFVALDLGSQLPAVFLDAPLVRELRRTGRALPAQVPVLHVLQHCRDLDFAAIRDQVRGAGDLVALLQPASHLLVLEAVRDLFGRVTLDVAAVRVRPTDLGRRFGRLSAAAGRIDGTVRALAARC